VEHQRGPEELLQAVARHSPQAVVCLGEAGRRMRLSIERVGLNLVDDAIPDNAGERWEEQPAVDGGPSAYFTTLPSS
jgi:pyroglutamyl-peptidase